MATNAPPRSGTVSRYRSWLACYPSRGADAPLSEADIEHLEPEPFDALALEDSSVLSIEAEALIALLLTRPAVARRWFVSLSKRMAGLVELHYRRVLLVDRVGLAEMLADGESS